MSVTSFPKAPAKRTLTEGQPVNNRSRVTTGRAVFAKADGRGPWGRRFRDLLHLHCDDLGGLSSLSECQLSLVRRMSALEIELERMEGELAEARDVDLDAYGRLSGHLRRIIETLGLHRVKRDVTPSLAEIVAQHKTKRAEAHAYAVMPVAEPSALLAQRSPAVVTDEEPVA